jgi:hypothetical protein
LLDEIEALITEAVNHLTQAQAAQALLRLTQVQGMLLVIQDEAGKWERIQKAYEAGARPSQLAARFGVKSQQIRTKAYYSNWQNPNKLAKQASARKNKNIFHLVCQSCELYFQSPSGHGKICNICQAFENMGKSKSNG